MEKAAAPPALLFGSAMKRNQPVPPVIKVEKVTKRFGTFAAVDGVSFEVRPGECFGILGPNGAGKTSTIKMIYGFSPISEGGLQVFGLDIRRKWREIRAQIGVCHQENSLDPELTVLENLIVYARFFDINRAAARRRALELLDLIALGQRRDSPVSELSGGMMRRLVLARALINNPCILILDEPTTGLDPQSRHQIWERLENLRADGISILLTTHYMDEAERLCDRLIIMDHGKILVEGAPGDLIRQYAKRNIIEFSNPAGEARNYLRENGIVHDDLGSRIISYFDARDNQYRTVRDEFCKEGCIIRLATLEDVFLKLTGRALRD